VSILSEIAKLKAAPAAGGSLGHFTSANDIDPIVEQRSIFAGSGGFSSGLQYAASSSYKRIFNHNSGQFSIVSRHYGSAGTEVYCKPFTVNQTTGAITEGSGAAFFTASSNIDTGTFSQNGNYIMTQHTSGSNGNTTSACTVSGNSVSGTANVASSTMQPATNSDAASFRSGSTMYMYPQVYSTSTGTMHRYTASYNGSSVSNHSGPGNPSSTTSTHYTYPVRGQHGQTNGPTAGAGIRQWQGSNRVQYFDILNTSGTESANQISVQALGVGSQNSPFEGYGIELSNGRQLFYCDQGTIILRDGNTLTNVSGSADFIPKTFNNFISDIGTGAAADTWIAISSNDYKELVRFSVNPTTYRVTILESFPLFKYLKGNNSTSSLDHISFTGSSNQFIVMGKPIQGIPSAFIQVFRSPFTL
jgi:hypothetical protein